MNKKVAFVIDNITSTGGTERFLAVLTNHLCKKTNVEIYSLLSKKNDTIFFDTNENVKITHFNGGKDRYIRAIKKIKSENFDAVIIVSMGKLSFIMTLFYKLFFIKSKLILSEHITFFKYSKFIKFLKLFSYTLADKICVLTNMDYDYLTKYKKIKNNVVVMPNISPFAIEENSDTNFNSKKIISIGSLIDRKGFDDMIKIWKIFSKSNTDYYLEIIGIGEKYNELHKLIVDNGLSKTIILKNKTQNSYEALKSSKLFLMTSHYEGLPMVLIEAQSLSIPSISFDCDTGPRDIIMDGKTGFLIKNRDKNDFANKLNTILSNNTAYLEFAKNSSIFAKRFEPENITEKWLNLF